ncbi:MAG: hypothetical protein QNJ16_13040 [Rhodobacter sp.]|nr:hypothetical protein [Rhodobacter sp.]
MALTKLTGIPFRLAASGLQGGVDGESAFLDDAVSFEAKRYASNIGREAVITKIADFARRDTAADRLWVLGATTEVPALISEAVRQDGDRNAISTLIVDWTGPSIPLLAVAVVAAGDDGIEFLSKNFDPKTGQKTVSREELGAAYFAVSKHSEFADLYLRLRSNLDGSKLALRRAAERNFQWRQKTFGSALESRNRLGQSLAVLEYVDLPRLRTDIRSALSKKLASKTDIVLLGDEGHGKSWLSAQICAESKGVALFASAERFDGVAYDDLDDLLIELLIKQAGDASDEALKQRWRHRLQTWKSAPPSEPILVVVDGINQRQKFRWDRLLNGLQSILYGIGGSLIITVRPQYWVKAVSRGIAFKPETIKVPQWAPPERDKLLDYYGVDLDWLDDSTLGTLRNPRLLCVAVSTLPHNEAAVWKGLTTDRLLMEHLRASQLDSFEDNETFSTLAKRLSDHAKQVLDHARSSGSEPPQGFQADSQAVIETRFFRPVEGPGDLYKLREDGLTLALGFTLVDQLWQAHRAGRNLSERVVQLVEPINAMDRTADVIFSALLVCSLDEDIRFDKEIFAALLDAFANLQNVADQRFEEFIEIIKHQPTAFFDVLKGLCLERGQRINQDWFRHAAFEIASTDAGWKAAESAIHQWLRCYNKDPVEQSNRYSRQNEAEYQERLQRTREEINQALETLSAFESQLLEKMTEVPEEPDGLFTLALELLAGRELAPFAESFVAMGLAFGLDTSLYSARKAFRQLTTFNKVDRAEMKNSFVEAVEPLRSPDTSPGGKWTLVRMLYASGDEAAAREAKQIAEELRKDWPFFDMPAPNEWRQVDAADPNAAPPVDLQSGISRFEVLEASSVKRTMSFGSEDHDFKDFLPIACRFNAQVAIDKTRCILDEFMTREGLPLRQAILNCEEHLPLISAELARNFAERVRTSDVIASISEGDQNICRMFAFYYSVGQLSADEQLECMTSNDFGPDYLLATIPSLKPQSTRAITTALKSAQKGDDEGAAYGALAAALHGGVEVSAELEDLVLCHRIATLSKLRAACFELAIDKNLAKVRLAHVDGVWTAQSADANTFESWFGSMLLVEACALGELPIEDLLNRIDQKTWFAAARRLGTEFAEPMAKCFLQRLSGGVKAADKLSPPPADLTLTTAEPAPYPFWSADETNRDEGRFPRQKSLKEILAVDDNFDERRDQLRAITQAFFDELKDADAQTLVHRITFDEVRHLTAMVPSLLSDLVGLIEGARKAQFFWLKNLALVVARLISENDPEKAVSFIERAIASQGFVTQALGDDLTLEHEAIWGSSPSEPMHKLWRRRLLCAKNDAILAREVLAAERFGASAFIDDLARELASSHDGLDHAYAATIAGFSRESGRMIDVIEKHAEDEGISGDASKRALSSHRSNRWAQEWVEKMWDASTPDEFWRCMVIGKTCMDARVSSAPKTGSTWAHFAPVFRSVRKEALKAKVRDREKKLVGQEVPDEVFIAVAA